MTDQEFSLGLAFFWFGFTLIFFLFFCIAHIQSNGSHVKGSSNVKFRPGWLDRLILTVLGLSGAWGLATLLGMYRSSDPYVQVFMLGGILIGIPVSVRVMGWPDFHKV